MAFEFEMKTQDSHIVGFHRSKWGRKLQIKVGEEIIHTSYAELYYSLLGVIALGFVLTILFFLNHQLMGVYSDQIEVFFLVVPGSWAAYILFYFISFEYVRYILFKERTFKFSVEEKSVEITMIIPRFSFGGVPRDYNIILNGELVESFSENSSHSPRKINL